MSKQTGQSYSALSTMTDSEICDTVGSMPFVKNSTINIWHYPMLAVCLLWDLCMSLVKSDYLLTETQGRPLTASIYLLKGGLFA